MLARQSLPPGSKPRLVRQAAVQEDTSQELSTSPPRLSVRFLPTIPSAADSSIQLDDETNDAGTPFYTILQSGTPQTTLSSPKDKTKPP